MSMRCSPLRPSASIGAALMAAALTVSALPTPAQAWGVFVGIAPPIFYPPPVMYPSPYYYRPPPAYYPAPPFAYGAPPPPGRPGQSCYAGNSPICPMDHPSATGNTYWCSTGSGRVYGTVH